MIFEKKTLVISSGWNVFPFFFTKGNKLQFNPDQLPSGVCVVSSVQGREFTVQIQTIPPQTKV